MLYALTYLLSLARELFLKYARPPAVTDYILSKTLSEQVKIDALVKFSIQNPQTGTGSKPALRPSLGIRA